MEVCHRWVERCDAIYVIGASPGTDSELTVATARGMPVYRSLADVPPTRAEGRRVTSAATANPDYDGEKVDSTDAIVLGYMTEYEQCAESYRHTYATIWQAGGLFGIISGAIVAIGSTQGSLDPIIQVLAPLPLVFWYLGIFRPMNRYGEWRSRRLSDLEARLEDIVPGLDMWHFRQYEADRKSESGVYRLVTFKWVWRPRVSEIVSIFGTALLIAEVLLIWVYYL
jgi:hypothetical protein